MKSLYFKKLEPTVDVSLSMFNLIPRV